jgi:hypothetical protein
MSAAPIGRVNFSSTWQRWAKTPALVVEIFAPQSGQSSQLFAVATSVLRPFPSVRGDLDLRANEVQCVLVIISFKALPIPA